jgi:hypothetical protein
MSWTNGLVPIVTLIASSVFGQSTNIVIPAGLENLEGDEILAVPFTAPIDARSQSLYGASSFPGPTVITQIAYRLDGGAQSVNFTITDIQINFSTFAGANLSTTFANNVGSDETVVLNRGSLPIVMGGGSSPNAFDLVINLDHPFSYDPADGDLLVDIVKYSGEFARQNLDSQSTLNVSTIFSSDALTSTGGALHEVLVAQFTVVPEPQPITLLLVGCVSLLIYSRRAE